ncbi:hypothetical protein L1987_30005 [Smallanthus sonchifolius]|uniref:Uncharacterized protein n=1 Tax=Smallanthus sonchifolius TaxID=185202 RepID=A0ACB9I2T1_9ASTR|nr:hypothetical protein L1987_30005 [Smallanthus sonchifolius]
MLYGTECSAIKKTQARKMDVAEMRMLRWMCGHTRKDRIRNEVVRKRLGVTCILDKIREGRLRWFGHVKTRQSTDPVRTVETLVVEGKRSRGRPKLTWDERIRLDLLDLHLSEDMINDRISWRRRIRAIPCPYKSCINPCSILCLSNSEVLTYWCVSLIGNSIVLVSAMICPTQGLDQNPSWAYTLFQPSCINNTIVGLMVMMRIVVNWALWPERLQVEQSDAGILIHQAKYVKDILTKFKMNDYKSASTPIAPHEPLTMDLSGVEVNKKAYRSMIGCLMYLTASRSDIMFAVCSGARYQAAPNVRNKRMYPHQLLKQSMQPLRAVAHRTSAFDQIGEVFRRAFVCLATHIKFNFSRMTFEDMISNFVGPRHNYKFLMYRKLNQMFINTLLHELPNDGIELPFERIQEVIFSSMNNVIKTSRFSGTTTPLFPNMLAENTDPELNIDDEIDDLMASDIEDGVDNDSIGDGDDNQGYDGGEGNVIPNVHPEVQA